MTAPRLHPRVEWILILGGLLYDLGGWYDTEGHVLPARVERDLGRRVAKLLLNDDLAGAVELLRTELPDGPRCVEMEIAEGLAAVRHRAWLSEARDQIDALPHSALWWFISCGTGTHLHRDRLVDAARNASAMLRSVAEERHLASIAKSEASP